MSIYINFVKNLLETIFLELYCLNQKYKRKYILQGDCLHGTRLFSNIFEFRKDTILHETYK